MLIKTTAGRRLDLSRAHHIYTGMSLRVPILALLLYAAPALAADRPPAGVLWNRSGLPAVFPLVVKTDPGRDLYLTLTDPSGKAVMGAYLRGGQMFRILVPKGPLVLGFASGPQPWQGEAGLFGPDTRWETLPSPLPFGVTGLGRKSGQVIDLRGDPAPADAVAGAHRQVICQTWRLDPRSLKLQPRPGPYGPGQPGMHFTAPHGHITSRVCE